MDLASIASLIGAAGQFAGGVGGLFNSGSGGSNNAVQQNMMQMWRNDDLYRAKRNEEMAYEFAQNGIRWRVEDARRAGIHPLAALGASGAASAPISISGGYQPAGESAYSRGADIGASLSQMGQGLGRAVAATQTKVERQLTAFELMRQEQQIRANDLDIAIKAATLDRMTNPSQIGPGMPNVTSSRQGVYEAKPAEVITADPNRPGYTAGPAHPNATVQRAPSGDVYTVPHKDLNMDEFSSPGYMTWMIHNKVLPYISQRYRDAARPSNADLPPGAIAWRLGAPGMGWLPVYRDIPDRDRQGHLSSRGYYSFYD